VVWFGVFLALHELHCVSLSEVAQPYRVHPHAILFELASELLELDGAAAVRIELNEDVEQFVLL